ncbi:FecCD family ABC transporter permease [Parendozoicomonas haliclonae]|uniref:Hemin transport system permease protein HmuU n=1 Tax=Parendozoicomonas haliclonae TaxID=1960125 RepID=A0A1X7ALG0_9GAMM|nr:iron ABC transporter permease [Parendozoicomonas haliclonae]SMA48840.1 Hemin transport system permease protein HmuU [Parendozoicomonas haliclonae]
MKSYGHSLTCLIFLVTGLFASLVLAIGFGSTDISAGVVLDAMIQGIRGTIDQASVDASVIWHLRLPRTVMAALAGAGLATVGSALQSANRNPLADPYLFGIASGASLGAVVVLTQTGLFLGDITLPLGAFIGALGSVGLVLTMAGSLQQTSVERMILSGVAVSFVLMALTNLMLFLAETRAVASAMFWMMGGLDRALWNQLLFPAIALVGGVMFLFSKADALNAMMCGDESALTLGVDVPRLRYQIFGIAALITATIVAIAGAIGFVGLMVPHAVRLLSGADNRLVLPFSALSGAIFLIWVDVMARTIAAPQEIPVGILTAAFGSVFMVIYMKNRGGHS